MREKWNKKAKTYAKFDGNLSEFGKRIFAIFRDENIDFEGKTLIDVGAGTGVYSLYLATLGAKVCALDSSEGMLNELRKSALKYGIRLEKIINDDFANFAKFNERKFDIAFLSMAPALQSEADFDSFLALGERKIYINWASDRNSSMLAPIFAHFGVEKSPVDLSTQNFELNLKNKSIKFSSHLLSEKRIMKRNLGEAVENALWHLGMSDVKANSYEVQKLLENKVQNGIITDEINATFKIFII